MNLKKNWLMSISLNGTQSLPMLPHIGISAKHLSEVIKEETGNTALQIIHERLLLESQYL